MPHPIEPLLQTHSPPPSIFRPLCHPLVDEAVRDVDGYYLKYWKFGSEKARKKFVAAGFSRVSCLYFPKAEDDRIRYVCSLLTILFLVDDELEHMSLHDGKKHNEILMPLCAGDALPDRSIPVQWIMFDLWESMRACDRDLADAVLEPVFTFMRAQTSKARLSIKGFNEYLEYRQGDVGQALLAALTRFSMSLNLSAEELGSVAGMERNVGQHISIVNDIYSYEKELLAAQTAHEEGGKLCNAVQILASEVNLGVGSSKRVLWSICREWEHTHEELVSEQNSRDCGDKVVSYMEGLEFHMSGNELWSSTTKRYHNVKA